jgi:hypothetical protein
MTHAWLLTLLPPTVQPQVRPSFMINALIEAREMREMGPDSRIVRNIGSSLVPFRRSPGPADPSLESIQVPDGVPAAGEEKRAAVAKIQPDRKLRLPPDVEPKLRPLLQPVDMNWYGAHELDSYPRALAPFRFDHPTGAGLEHTGARLLVWLRIDEHGQVVEVAAGEAGVPERLVEATRASVAAVKFVPARKDERAVKSRLLVRIDFARGGEERGSEFP